MPPIRTTPNLVQGVLRAGVDGTNWDGQTDLQQFINIANPIVSRVVRDAARYKEISITWEEQCNICTLLAAHLYIMTDRTYKSRGQGGSSASFDGNTDMYLESSLYGQGACLADPSGCLRNIGKQQRARGFGPGS
jgi:hypothetical protein